MSDYKAQQLEPSIRNKKLFQDEIRAIRDEVVAHLSEKDRDQLLKFEWWGRLCTIVGYALAWIAPNPVSPFLIARGITTRWMIGHQVSHRGYDRVPGIPKRLTSRHFGRGFRRFIDWFDWNTPEAWQLEHVYLHHVYTGERKDPALIERNMKYLRRSNMPMWLRYLMIFLTAATWKWSFYAPQSFMLVQNARKGEWEFRNLYKLFNPFNARGLEFWTVCLLPYAFFRLVLIPSLFLLISHRAAEFVLVNSLLAEVVASLETFVVIAPNHTGEDLRVYGDKPRGKEEYFIRQVLTTTNYPGGTDFRDFLYYFVNYQIEHHIWPDIPLSKYQEIRSRFKKVCADHQVTYVEEPVLRRLRKTLDVLVGKRAMKQTTSDELRAEFRLI